MGLPVKSIVRACWLGERIVLAVRTDAGHQLVLDDADRHVAVDHEREPTEHLLLSYAVGVTGEHVTDSVRERFVVCHA